MPRRETAISILAAALTRLAERPLPARRDSAGYLVLDALAPEMSGLSRFVLANRWLFGPLVERQLAAAPSSDAMLRTTMVATIVSGGVKENVVPSRARAVINFRLLPGDESAWVIDEVRRRLADPRVVIAVSGEWKEASPVSAAEGWGFRQVAEAIVAVDPTIKVAPALVLGATDGRHFTAISDQVLRFAPVWLRAEDLPRLHGTNERIAVDLLPFAVRFYRRLIETSCGRK